MKNKFHFRTLLQLRQEDKFFSVLGKGMLFEFFIAFLHEAYDEKDNKELTQQVFLGMYAKFRLREMAAFTENDMEPPEPDNALKLMMSEGYNLVMRRIFWDNRGQEADFRLVPTDTYVDVVRLLEERGQYTTLGSNLEIRGTIDAVRNAADIISGDVAKQKESLKAKIAEMQQELDRLEKTGKAKEVSPEEVREQVFYIKRCVNNITTVLSRGTASFREDCSLFWEGLSKEMSDNKEKGSYSSGSVATDVLNGLLGFLKSDAVRSYESALELLVNPEEQQALTDSLERISKNPEARKIMREDDIDMNKVLRRIIRDSAACYEVIHKEISRLNAYMRSGEIERNRLLYQKADEILLFWKENETVPFRRHLFKIPGGTPQVLSPVQLAVRKIKPKIELVRPKQQKEPDKGKTAENARRYRDIRVVDIPGKFRHLLDKFDGKFTLKDYIEVEGTSFGLYEFLVVRQIMARYMGSSMVQPAITGEGKTLRVTDFAPKDGNVDYKEIMLSSHIYQFDEGAYLQWKKDKFRI